MSKRNGKILVQWNHLLDQFLLIENHPSYMINNKIYKSQEKFALINVKHHLKKVIKRYNTLDPKIAKLNSEKIKGFQEKIMESLNIILRYEEFNLKIEELNKYSLYIQETVNNLDDLVSNLETKNFEEIDKLEIENIHDRRELLKHRFEDNIDQLLKSFTWKEYEVKILNSENDDDFMEFTKLLSSFNSSKIIGSQLENINNLELLARFSTFLKDRLAENFEDAFFFIPLLHSLCQLFEDNSDIYLPDEDKHIPIDYFRQTIDHYINLSRIDWLGNFYRSFMEDNMLIDQNKIYKKFAIEFYKTTHDPRKDFLWTMRYYSRLKRDEELITLSYKVANLTTMLLTILDKLESVGSSSLVRSIINLKDIGYEDAISDFSDIYKIRKDWGRYMKQALNNKLKDLKDILLQIIQFDEISDEILFLMQHEIDHNHNLFPVNSENLEFVIKNY